MSTTIVTKETDYRSTDPPIVGTLRHALSLPTPRRIIITVKEIELVEALTISQPYLNILSAVGTIIYAAPQVAVFSEKGILENLTIIAGRGNWRPLVLGGTGCHDWLIRSCTSVSQDDDGFNVYLGANRILFDQCIFRGLEKGALIDSETTTPCPDVTFDNCIFRESEIRVPLIAGQAPATVKNCKIYVNLAGLEFQRAGSKVNIINNIFYGESPYNYYPARIQVDIDPATPNLIYSEGNKWFVNGVEREFKVGQLVAPPGLPVPDSMYSPTPFSVLLPDLTGVPV